MIEPNVPTFHDLIENAKTSWTRGETYTIGRAKLHTLLMALGFDATKYVANDIGIPCVVLKSFFPSIRANASKRDYIPVFDIFNMRARNFIWTPDLSLALSYLRSFNQPSLAGIAEGYITDEVFGTTFVSLQEPTLLDNTSLCSSGLVYIRTAFGFVYGVPTESTRFNFTPLRFFGPQESDPDAVVE